MGDSDVEETKKPIYKAVTINDHILKVVKDVLVLKREGKRVKHEKQEMLPPLTTTYKQFDTIRAVHDSYRAFRYEIQECSIKKKEREEELEEVKSTCEAYRETIMNFTTFITQNYEKRQRTFNQIEGNLRQLNKYTYDNRRYLRCAQELLYIRDVLQKLIDQNTCYVTFMETVAGHSVRYNSSESVAVRYKALNKTRERLTSKYNEAMVKIQGYRDNVFKEDNKGMSELFDALQRLQKVGYELEQIKEKTSLFEMSISKIRTQSVDKMMVMCQVLKSVEPLVDHLIQWGFSTAEIRSMTLSQQLEKIKQEHFRQKNILKEHHNAISLEQKHHVRRVSRMREREREKTLAQTNRRKLKTLQQNWRSMVRAIKPGNNVLKEVASLGLDAMDLALLNRDSKMDLTVERKRRKPAEIHVSDIELTPSTPTVTSDSPDTTESYASSSSTEIEQVVVPRPKTPPPEETEESQFPGKQLVDPAREYYLREKELRKLLRQEASESSSDSYNLSISSYDNISQESETIKPMAALSDTKSEDKSKKKRKERRRKTRRTRSKGEEESTEEESSSASLPTIETLSVDSSIESLPSFASRISYDSQSSDEFDYSIAD